MSYYCNCLSFRGNAHIKNNMPCQDASGYLKGDNYSILSVADGHGDSAYFRSDIGSYLAVKTSLSFVNSFILEHGLQKWSNSIEKKFKNGLVSSWYNAVDNHVNNHPFDSNERSLLFNAKDQKAYGTTLIVVVVSESFSLLVQVGDGRIASIDNNGVVDLNPHHFYDDLDSNSEFELTSSLAQDNINFRFLPVDSDIPYSYALFTDGLEKAFNPSNLSQRILASAILSQIEDKWYISVADMINDCSIREGDDVSLALAVNTKMDLKSLFVKTFSISAPEITPIKLSNSGKISLNGSKVSEDLFSEDAEISFSNGIHYKTKLINGAASEDLHDYTINGSLSSLRYSGPLSNLLPQGSGMLFSDDVLLFKGSFKKGHISGKGLMYYRDGSSLKYDGQFKNDLFDGKGRQFYSNGSIQFEGLFKGGHWSEGLYYKDLMKGSRLQYRGKFVGDLCHDPNGLCYDPSGNLIYQGSILNGKRCGKGIEYFANIPNEWKYEGTFENDKYEGSGTLRAVYHKTQEIYIRFKDQIFVQGYISGPGVELYPDGTVRYRGNFEHSLPSGRGVMYSETGEIENDGLFENGMAVPNISGQLNIDYTSTNRFHPTTQQVLDSMDVLPYLKLCRPDGFEPFINKINSFELKAYKIVVNGLTPSKIASMSDNMFNKELSNRSSQLIGVPGFKDTMTFEFTKQILLKIISRYKIEKQNRLMKSNLD